MPTKAKPKPKPKAKAKPKAKEDKVKPKKEPKGIVFKIDNTEETINENKYAAKVKKIIQNLKNNSVETDNRIRFCWKN